MTNQNISNDEMVSVFDEASQFDDTFGTSPKSHGELLKRHVAPISYSREALYGRDAGRQTMCFDWISSTVAATIYRHGTR